MRSMKLTLLGVCLGLLAGCAGAPAATPTSTPVAAATEPEPTSTPATKGGPRTTAEVPPATPSGPGPESPGPAVASLNRPADPVVLTGADLPGLAGLSPAEIVAFRFGPSGWQPIPLQVDERRLLNLGDLYRREDPQAPQFIFYADPVLFPDADPAFDADDELVLMAQDAGLPAPADSAPAGVLPDTRLEVSLRDPLDPAAAGTIYLFRQAGSLDPAAGRAYVVYSGPPSQADNADAKSKDGRPARQLASEDSTIETATYAHHFSARWVLDELRFMANGDERDLLDRFRVQLRPGDCDRSEDTFSSAQGFFVINKNGPVRAIRSYIGANSGTYTQRLHLFYANRQEMATFVRVHALVGLMDMVDYSPDAAGLTYYNNLNPGGVTIDGRPDVVAGGVIDWELVSGPPGSLFMAYRLETDIPAGDMARESYYQDEAAPTVPTCTGDGRAFGLSGSYFHPVPCTDPARAVADPRHCPTAHQLLLGRTIYYEAPNLTPDAAAALYRRWQSPLQVAVH